MDDDNASAQELAALHAAVLRDHDRWVGMGPTPRARRVTRRLQRLHLSWLLTPWYLVLAARFFLPGSWRRLAADEGQAVRLHRRLSGTDPQVARAEVWRIGTQLGVLDERLRDLDEQRPGAPRGADRAGVATAAAALIGYHLAGRRTDDQLLVEVQAAWAACEELYEQHRQRGRDPVDADRRVRAATDRYLLAWGRWLDRQAGTSAGC